MKKILLALIFLPLLSLAYTISDVSNAEFLAHQGIISSQKITQGYRLNDTITRAEAAAIVLKIKGVIVPSRYVCKGIFEDSKYEKGKGWVCQTVEIAASEGIINSSNKKARPYEKVTRMEILTMLARIPKIKLFLDKFDGYNLFLGKFGTKTEAENLLLSQYFSFGSILHHQDYDYRIVPINGPVAFDQTEVKFYPYQSATRAEVFKYSKSVLDSLGLCNDCANKNQIIINDITNYPTDSLFENAKMSFGNQVTVNGEGGSMESYECVLRIKTSDYPMSVFDDFFTILDKKTQNNITYFEVNTEINSVYQIILGKRYQYILSDYSIGKNCLSRLKIQNLVLISRISILEVYYLFLSIGNYDGAFQMRSPSGVSLEIFQGWYKDVTSINFRQETLKDLGNNTYEFLVDMVENGVKSTYKVKSKIDLENFKINNISSAKQ